MGKNKKQKQKKIVIETKAKVGRPKIDIPKNKPVMSYFTANEHKALAELAKSKGYSLSNFVRIVALRELLPEDK